MATDTVATNAGRVGVFGGAFDPVHRAHLALAEAASSQFQLQKVVLIPSGNPPHRALNGASGEHRLAMLRLAVQHRPNFEVDDWELSRPGTTYSILTLEHLSSVKDAEFFFLMGEDSLHQFISWKNWQGILDLCHLCVASRKAESHVDVPAELRERFVAPGSRNENLAGNIYFVDFDEMPISATDIRNRLARGEDVEDFLEPAVLTYIREQRLYQNA